MEEVTGKYGTAKVFTDIIEQTAKSQLITLLNQDFISGAKVRVMPDVHAGVGCTIGFTAELKDKVIPFLVGVDIGCGMLVVSLGKRNIDLNELDHIIHKFIPAGKAVHESAVDTSFNLQSLVSFSFLQDTGRLMKSIGTLGGGNHFIELNVDNDGNQYLVIHSGSRNLGKQVADYYQNLAVERCKGLGDEKTEREFLIKKLKQEGRQKEIATSLKELEATFNYTQPKYPKELCFLTFDDRENYLWDMAICQGYAILNRETMARIILNSLFRKELDDYSNFHTIHNYINFKDNIIRKGAVSAYKDEEFIIPINMKVGSLICKGLGNEDWNYSAPHGAGRLMSRGDAKRRISMDEFKKSMEGIFSTTVNSSTIDEAPMAYKPVESILDNIKETATVEKVIKPIYNFKSSE